MPFRNVPIITRAAVLLSACGLACLVAPARAQNLVTNGNFEANIGNPVGYSLTGGTGRSGVFSGFGVGSSNGFVNFEAATSPNLFQQITTTSGTGYTFSFAVKPSSTGDGINSFMAIFDGVTVFSFTNNASIVFSLQSFNVTATGASTPISFIGFGDGGNLGDSLYLDNVSVVAVPEAGSLALLLPALSIMSLVVRRTRRVV